MTYGMSIVEQDELIKTLSNEQLQNYANNPDGTLPLYLVVAQLKRNEDTRGRFSALQAEQQTAQQPRTVVERLAPPRHGEIPVPSSQVAANPAPQIPLQQAGGAPQMPTINAQGGMDFEKMVAAFAKVAAAEQKEEEVDMRKPDHFGSERRGSFERGGETPTSQYPATTFAALRKALADKEGSRVHRGRQTRGPYQPEGKKGRFTAAARHGRELTDRDFYTWNPLEMAMTQGGLAGLSKRRRGRTVNAQDGFSYGWTPGGAGADTISGRSAERFRLAEMRKRLAAAQAEDAAVQAFVPKAGTDGFSYRPLNGVDIAGKSAERVRLVEESIAAEAAAAQAAAATAAVAETGDPPGLRTDTISERALERFRSVEDRRATEAANVEALQAVVPNVGTGAGNIAGRSAERVRLAEERRDQILRASAVAEALKPDAEKARRGPPPPPSVGFPFQRSADISAAAAIEADPNLVLGETPAAQRMIKILEMTPEGRQKLEIARGIVSETDVPGAAVTPPAEKDMGLLGTKEEGWVDPAYLAELQQQDDEAAQAARERRAKKIAAHTATVTEQRKQILGLVTNNGAKSGGQVDQSKINPNIDPLIKAAEKRIRDNTTSPDEKNAVMEFLTNTRADAKSSRRARDKLMREAMATTAKASADAIGNAERIRSGIKEFSETGRLPKGRRDALLNKLLLTWASSLLGNPTLADAMSQGFAASTNVIEGEQKNYSKAMMDNLEAEKAIGDLKVKAAASKQEALLSIAKASDADAKGDREDALKMLKIAADKRKDEMTHLRGLVQNYASLKSAKAQMISAQRLTETQWKARNLERAISTKYDQYFADFIAAEKLAIKEGGDPLQATRAVSKGYETHFNYNKEGVLTSKAWKATSPLFIAAARLGEKAASSYTAENLGLKYGAMTTKAAGLVVKRDPEMQADKTTVAVLESIAGETFTFPPEIDPNFAGLLAKHAAEIRRNFSKLYRARKKWEETGRRGPDPVGRGTADIKYNRQGKRIN
jgi:hypothetical protein